MAQYNQKCPHCGVHRLYLDDHIERVHGIDSGRPSRNPRNVNGTNIPNYQPLIVEEIIPAVSYPAPLAVDAVAAAPPDFLQDFHNLKETVINLSFEVTGKNLMERSEKEKADKLSHIGGICHPRELIDEMTEILKAQKDKIEASE